MPGEEHTWLDLSIAPQEALDSIRPLAASEIDYHEVSSKVGNVRNNSPDLIQKVTDWCAAIFNYKAKNKTKKKAYPPKVNMPFISKF